MNSTHTNSQMGKLTLVMPIGAPASGKTTLRKFICQEKGYDSLPAEITSNLKEEIESMERQFGTYDKIISTCRDELYQEILDRSMAEGKKKSQRAIRRELFDKLVDFQSEVYNWRVMNPGANIWVYLDSSNAQKGGRDYIISEFNPDRVIMLNFRREPEQLYQRAMERKGHPTFPIDSESQKSIIDKIYPIMEFAEPDKVENENENRNYQLHIIEF